MAQLNKYDFSFVVGGLYRLRGPLKFGAGEPHLRPTGGPRGGHGGGRVMAVQRISSLVVERRALLRVVIEAEQRVEGLVMLRW